MVCQPECRAWECNQIELDKKETGKHSASFLCYNTVSMKRVVIIIIALIILSGGLYWYLYQPDEELSTTDKGFQFIRDSYQGFRYEDSYLQYRYPTENLSCAGVPGCDLSYRLLDAYFDVVMLSRAGASETDLGQQLTDADQVFEAILPTWESGTIKDTLASEGSEDYALDTYCIMGYLFEDKVMADIVAGYRTGQGWFESDHFPQDTWRNIADETWCLRLLMITEKDINILPEAVQRKIIETNKYLTEEPLINQQAVLYHMVQLLNDAIEAGVDLDEAQSTLDSYSDQLVLLTMENELWSQPLALANTLEALASIGYSDKEILGKIVDRLTALQREDGSWWANPVSNNGNVFTTLRANLALLEYKKLNNNQ